MLEFLKKKYSKIENAIIESSKPQLTTAQLVEQIHDDFFTEVNKILESANIMNSLDSQHQDLVDKSKRLKDSGFTNSKEVRESEIELNRISKLRHDNESKKSIIKAINYFSVRYPQYKFITEQSVKKICEKYGLVYSKIQNYIGSVPDKNLKHIEDFKIKDEDKCYIREESWGWGDSIDIRFIDQSQYNYGLTNGTIRNNHRTVSYKISPLEIAATVGDFNTKGKQVEDFKLKNIPVPPDPIVLHPVLFEDKKYYLIVTAWGPEASDADVVNERMN